MVAPGVGGVKRAKLVADKLDTDLAILHKLHKYVGGCLHDLCVFTF